MIGAPRHRPGAATANRAVMAAGLVMASPTHTAYAPSSNARRTCSGAVTRPSTRTGTFTAATSSSTNARSGRVGHGRPAVWRVTGQRGRDDVGTGGDSSNPFRQRGDVRHRRHLQLSMDARDQLRQRDVAGPRPVCGVERHQVRPSRHDLLGQIECGGDKRLITLESPFIDAKNRQAGQPAGGCDVCRPVDAQAGRPAALSLLGHGAHEYRALQDTAFFGLAGDDQAAAQAGEDGVLCDRHMSSLKSLHAGFIVFINSSFFVLDQPLICFSR